MSFKKDNFVNQGYVSLPRPGGFSQLKVQYDNMVAVESNTITMNECYENYILIDTGTNLTNKKFVRDLESVVKRATDAGVKQMIVSGNSITSSMEALQLTHIYPGTLYSTAGVHPNDAKSWTEETLDELTEIASCSGCVAIGECGLDYTWFRDFTPPEVQQDVFEKQVKLACELKKPLFLHERNAHDDLIRILKKYSDSLPPMVIHSFTGSLAQVKTYIQMGAYIGITGYLCKNSSEDGVQALLREGHIPLTNILVESDSPFMYPSTQGTKLPANIKKALTKRSLTFLHQYCTFQRNEPCCLPALVEMIAALLEKSPEDVASQTKFNALKVFDLS